MVSHPAPVPVRTEIRFLLNDAEVRLGEVAPSDTLLGYLRRRARLMGTKEGCAEGDCGACTVLIGRIGPKGLAYESANACIRLIASLDGCHVVTVEHLGGRHPVQRALVGHHGSQCGFCTPGIVMALYGLWRHTREPSREEVETALQGNLCRCTGYAPILRAMAALEDGEDPLEAEAATTEARLRALGDGARVTVERAGARAILPRDTDDLAAVLTEEPGATMVAGATDVGVWVAKEGRAISPAVFLGHLAPLAAIEETAAGTVFGAGTSYTAAREVIARRHPWLGAYWARIGGEQVRNAGTLGGNIANASPIGDTPPPLIVLGATLSLRSKRGRRSMPLEDFFLDYGRQDRAADEFIESITVPDAGAGDLLAAYKISKRRDEDISALTLALRLRLRDGLVREARIACGGMAGIPKRARAVEARLLGRPWSEATALEAGAGFAEDFTPIGDWRASAEYRARAVRNLLHRFWLESAGGAGALDRLGAA
ncbi:MAG: xanthine dehydrogenase small subunit [Pseudomonadota bacterium]